MKILTKSITHCKDVGFCSCSRGVSLKGYFGCTRLCTKHVGERNSKTLPDTHTYKAPHKHLAHIHDIKITFAWRQEYETKKDRQNSQKSVLHHHVLTHLHLGLLKIRVYPRHFEGKVIVLVLHGLDVFHPEFVNVMMLVF